jgi:hypothetical protein
MLTIHQALLATLQHIESDPIPYYMDTRYSYLQTTVSDAEMYSKIIYIHIYTIFVIIMHRIHWRSQRLDCRCKVKHIH